MFEIEEVRMLEEVTWIALNQLEYEVALSKNFTRADLVAHRTKKFDFNF